jgi:hypothetical protein
MRDILMRRQGEKRLEAGLQNCGGAANTYHCDQSFDGYRAEPAQRLSSGLRVKLDRSQKKPHRA